MTLRGMYDNVPWWKQILSLILIIVYSAACMVFKLIGLIPGHLRRKLFKSGGK